jgi:hypothetical protein
MTRYTPRASGPRIPRMPHLPNAACRNHPDLDWVPDSEDPREPNTAACRAVCDGCPDRVECAVWAIDARAVGIWGGLLTDQRAALRTSGLAALRVART